MDLKFSNMPETDIVAFSEGVIATLTELGLEYDFDETTTPSVEGECSFTVHGVLPQVTYCPEKPPAELVDTVLADLEESKRLDELWGDSMTPVTADGVPVDVGDLLHEIVWVDASRKWEVCVRPREVGKVDGCEVTLLKRISHRMTEFSDSRLYSSVEAAKKEVRKRNRAEREAGRRNQKESK